MRPSLTAVALLLHAHFPLKGGRERLLRAAQLGWKDAMHEHAMSVLREGEKEWFFWMGKVRQTCSIVASH